MRRAELCLSEAEYKTKNNMEFPKRRLPLEWEERWRREKERRKRVMEEGGEGIERDKRELSWIVAYNDSRMGLSPGTGKTERSEVPMGGARRPIGMGIGASEEDSEGERVHVCHSETSSMEIFRSLRDLRGSGLLTDLTLTTEDGTSIHAHSPILASVSSLILQRLREKPGAGSEGWSLSLGPEVDGAGLRAVVEFAYTGVVPRLNQDSQVSSQAAARVLGVPRVLDLCSQAAGMEDDGGTKKEDLERSALEETRLTLQSVERLRADGLGCDVVLEVDGTLFHVHRVVLAASSDYFRGMFTSGMKESRLSRVALPFLSAPELEALIGWSYSATIPLSWDCVFEVACTALQLQFPAVISLCLDFMRREMDARTCLDVASFAEAYEMSELLEDANDFVLRNFREVSSTAKFQDLPAEKLLDFLRCDGLCVPSELAVFRAVISWIQADPEERLGRAGPLMTAVRFPRMTFREFREVRAVNLRMESSGDKEVELYGLALKEFGFSPSQVQDQWRVRRPKDALVVVGGDQLNPDVGQRIPSKEVWFGNSLRSGTGLVKEVEWRRLGQMPDKPRFRHGVAALGGRLYVFGGCHFYAKDNLMKSAYSYNPEDSSWRRLADMLERRSNFSAVVRAGRLYAIGGDKEINTNVDSVEMYNPETDAWSFVRPLDRTGSGFAASVVDGAIYISGGFDSKYACLVSAFLYHPDTGSAPLADMTHDRAQHCMEALRGRLYVGGGMCNLRAFYTDQLACEVYDPASDSWSAVASLPVPHVGGASVVLEEKMYVMGGYCQDDDSDSPLVHRLDLGLRRWENMGRLPAAVTDIRACLLRLPPHLRL